MGGMFTLDEPDDVLRFLASPIRAVREALDHGVSWADIILDGMPRDPHMWAHAVRFAAREQLGAGSDAWTVRDLANSGIEVVASPVVMRTMKAQAGGPPSPGHSRTRRAYWMQQGTLALDWDGTREPVTGANLLLDWSLGSAREVFLSLSKPVSVWKYRGQPRVAWRRPVEFDDANVPHFVVSDESVDVEPKFDLTEFETGDADE
jgi:hypothetical protein